MASSHGAGTSGGHRLGRRVALLAAVLGLALLAASSDGLFALVQRMVADLEPLAARHPLAAAAVFTGLAALSAFLAFFSSTVLVPVAVEAWGGPAAAALLWAGWMVGGMFAYAVGRWMGRPLARRIAGEERFEFYHDRLGSRTPFWVVLLFHVALQSELPALVLGTLGYRFPKFLLALGLAELPYAAGSVFLGSLLLQRDTRLLAVGGALAVIATIAAVRALRRVLSEEAPSQTP
jgi:uncharacterized membrane protein YdjX (TVP38/TMEM64 family)